jgi:hypothetical protein
LRQEMDDRSMNLVSLINEIDPGHMDTRFRTLSRRRQILLDKGYNVKPISQHDIECFWLTLEHKGKVFKLDEIEMVDMYIEAIERDENSK